MLNLGTLSSRTVHLYHDLQNLQFFDAIRALELVIKEMCAEKGYKRHDNVHFYYHLVDVTQILINMRIKDNTDENLLISALLHDLAEDVPFYTIDKIAGLFNDDVAKTVDLLTKKNHINYKFPFELLAYLYEILQDENATYIKTSDRMHNFSTLRYAPIEKKMRQAYETETFFIPFFKLARNIYLDNSRLFFTAKTTIEPILHAMKAHFDTYSELQTLKNNPLLQ